MIRFKTTASKFENGEWNIIEGVVHRDWSKQPNNRIITREIDSILKDLRGMIPNFTSYEVEIIES
jgi:hypothetical protein